MAGILPEEVRWRGSKGDMSGWYVRALRTFEASRLEQTLTEDAYLIEPYVDIDALRSAHRHFQETVQLTSG